MRVASLSPAATEILFALGLHDLIVCVDQFSNHPAEAKNLPRVMGHQDIDASALAPFSPDLVLTGTVVQERLSRLLRDAGCSVVHQDPRSLDAVYESIRTLGQLFDREERAQAIVADMRSVFNDLKRKVARLLRRPRVYVEEWHDPPMASGNWVGEIVSLGGGTPFPIKAGELSRTVTLEEVRAFDPELIVISWCGAGLLADKNLLLDRSGWVDIPAVAAGRVRVIDDSLLNRPGPRLVEGARRVYGWLFEFLHSSA